MRLQPLIILLFCLATISFSKTVWEYQLDAPSSTNGVSFSTGILIGSQDGFVHLLSAQNGKPIWKRYIGPSLLTPLVLGDETAIFTQNGKIMVLRSDGSIRFNSMLPASILYGVTADGDILYATTNAGVFKILRAGNISKIYAENNTFTEPIIFNHNIVFGKGNELMMINQNGGITWRTQVGTVWKRPVAGANTIYVGTTDREIVAVSNGGNILWRTVLEGYAATPIISQGNVWVATTDWSVHRVNGITDEKYATPHGDFVNTPPVTLKLTGQEGIVFGGKYQVIMFNQEGLPVFSYPIRGTVVGLGTRLQNMLIVGDSTGKVLLIEVDKGCSIITPHGQTVIGKEEQKIEVAAFSKTADIASVEVRVNEGEWKSLEEKDGIYFTFIPNTLFEDFSDTIECRTTDSQGTQGNAYGQIEIYKDPSIPIQKMRMNLDGNLIENKEIILSVSDDRGKALEHVTITVNGVNAKTVDGSLKLSLQKGEYTLKAEKEGYSPITSKITIKSADEGNGSLLPIIVIGIAIVAGLILFLRRPKK